MKRSPTRTTIDVLDQAKAFLAAGDPAQADHLYATAFAELVAKADHFDASTVAHMAGVGHPDIAAKHRWNELAVREADAEPDRQSIEWFYPSLYNNLAFTHAQLGDTAEALRCLRNAWANVTKMEPGTYADRVKAAIKTRLEEFETKDRA